MQNPDVIFFVDGRPHALALYEALEDAVLARHPEAEVRVQKTQISFCNFLVLTLSKKK